MKLTFRKIAPVFVLTMLVLVISCSKDDENNDETQQPDAPVYIVKSVDLPDAMVQSSDPGASKAESFVGSANAYASLTEVMLPPAKSNGTKSANSDSWKFSWNVTSGPADYTANLTITEESDRYHWEMAITGTVDDNPYENWTYMEADQALDESWGTFTTYDLEGGGVGIYVTWTEDASGKLNLVFDASNIIRYSPVSNADGSGEVTSEAWDWGSSQYKVNFKAEWTAAGSGEWWEYVDGEVSDQGSW